MSLKSQMRYLNPYDLHKILINEYILKKPGDTTFFKRNTLNDKTDYDVLKSNHKFLWNDIVPDTWEAQFAKKYYDKLYKEYCIGDLSKYKENKIALRWRTEREVIASKGQFICGNKTCNCKDGLKTWEVNFAYQEDSEKKNALIKIRLCPDCSRKLNYHTRKKEVKRVKQKQLYGNKEKPASSTCEGTSTIIETGVTENEEIMKEANKTSSVQQEQSPWKNQKPEETKSREEEMEEYLEDLLL